MTEADWLSGADPAPMLEYTRWTASDRKLRLFTVACARLVWDRLPPGELREAVELAERVADGQPWEPELSAMCRRLYGRCAEYSRATGRNYLIDTPADELGAYFTVLQTTASPLSLHYTLARSVKQRFTHPLTGSQQPDFLRCILGNPFRTVTADPRWLSPTVLAIAEGIYAARAFDRLPVLAEALKDAGCDCPDLLVHCRGGGPHVRGCWAVDLVLGKG